LRKLTAGVVAGLLTLAFAGTAVAAPIQSFKLAYSSQKPAASTGINTNISSTDPSQPNNKPAAATDVLLTFNAGTKFNTNVPGVCKASDQQVKNQGAGACSQKSQIGTGTATANAFPLIANPVYENITAFNAPGSIIFLLTPGTNPTTGQPDTSGQTLVLRGTLHGTTLDTPVNVPPVAGIPISLTSFVLNIGAVKKGKKAWATTPAKCTGGKWTTKAKFTYADGTNLSVSSTSPCHK
jgi:hypothetical protein